ncbi:MAG TPA: AmmeMemoRadiSam system radical SAM enzyme [Vicinamibacterales bacterium]|nr:AmmeMemoRadiSam system radical SAM enzyme [Vicinamibacterales bacterium]HPW21266.1 AmmeMemoRadiSam system radical SAM enzyme [Vicinamibacterales bacterium]
MATRRAFLRTLACAVPASLWPPGAPGEAVQAPRAKYWVSGASAGPACRTCHPSAGALDRAHVHDPQGVLCQLCARNCAIKAGGSGRCGARANVNGELRSLVYGRPAAVHVDPIEKKPFYHFLPGRSAYSLGTVGCPLQCKFCQNWEISQARPGDYGSAFTSAEDVVRSAESRGAPVIAVTYNEPTVFAEYALDIAEAARLRGLRLAMVSCGYMNERPLADFCRAFDAIKIDLKGFSDAFYRAVSGAALAPVLRSIRQVRRSGRHLEIVNLVVPTLNDSDASLRGLADWVMGELGPDVPVHFTRFFPNYQLRNLAPTPVATLARARSLAMDRGIRYAYVGNVPGHPGNHTYCPTCGARVIAREDFFVLETKLLNGRCAACGSAVAGVWA